MAAVDAYSLALWDSWTFYQTVYVVLAIHRATDVRVEYWLVVRAVSHAFVHFAAADRYVFPVLAVLTLAAARTI